MIVWLLVSFILGLFVGGIIMALLVMGGDE